MIACHFPIRLVSSALRLESTLNYGMERGWALSVQGGSNHVALGYDEGCVLIQLGREEPAMSMDSSGKILWAKHTEIQQVGGEGPSVPDERARARARARN